MLTILRKFQIISISPKLQKPTPLGLIQISRRLCARTFFDISTRLVVLQNISRKLSAFRLFIVLFSYKIISRL